jgi:hypothetical protein
MATRRQARPRTFSIDSINSDNSSVDSTLSLTSTASIDSLSSSSNLPNLYEVPSASRNLRLKNDIQSLRQQIEKNCRKSIKKKKKKNNLDNIVVSYNDWDKWLRKHKKDTIVGGLSAQEFKTLFNWFSSRMKNNPDNVRGIKVANVVDDFMETGLYEDRAEAYDFVCKIDTKRNGEVSFNDFMAAFENTTDVSQLHFLKNFAKEISPEKNKPDRSQMGSRAVTRLGKSRNCNRKSSRSPTPMASVKANPRYPSILQEGRFHSGSPSSQGSNNHDTCLPSLPPSPIQKSTKGKRYTT